MDNLAKDIATGKGETLNTFSEMMSVPQTDRVKFHQTLQQNFRKIYPSASVTHLDVLAKIAEITG